jgi:hypothetical protein
MYDVAFLTEVHIPTEYAESVFQLEYHCDANNTVDAINFYATALNYFRII